MFGRRKQKIRSDQQLPPESPWVATGLPLTGADLGPGPVDQWMPDTVTDLPAVREEAMTTEPGTMYEDGESGRLSADDGLSPAERETIERMTNRQDCQHCRGTGKVLTTNDLLRESIGLLGDQGDEVMRVFYVNLLDTVPYLARLFPADLTSHTADGAGKMQRDKLLGALIAVSQTYDPDRPEQMQILDTHLQSFGRSHAAFDRGNGKVQGATLAEYNAVKVVLFNTLHDVAGDAWLPEYDDVWSEAYDYAAGGMLFYGMRSGFKSARYARP